MRVPARVLTDIIHLLTEHSPRRKAGFSVASPDGGEDPLEISLKRGS